MSSQSARDPYGVAIGAIRRFAHAGRFQPGEALVVTDLAAEIGLSPTPVREALARLAGEGLIERRKGRGYFYPVLSGAEIVDLYELQHAYVHACLTLHYRGALSLQRAAAATAAAAGIKGLFEAIVAEAGNEALVEAHGRVAARLATAIRTEICFVADNEEGEDMMAAAARGQLADLLELLASHHDRRCALAGQIAKSLQPGTTAPPIHELVGSRPQSDRATAPA